METEMATRLVALVVAVWAAASLFVLWLGAMQWLVQLLDERRGVRSVREFDRSLNEPDWYPDQLPQ